MHASGLLVCVMGFMARMPVVSWLDGFLCKLFVEFWYNRGMKLVGELVTSR